MVRLKIGAERSLDVLREKVFLNHDRLQKLFPSPDKTKPDEYKYGYYSVEVRYVNFSNADYFRPESKEDIIQWEKGVEDAIKAINQIDPLYLNNYNTYGRLKYEIDKFYDELNEKYGDPSN